MADVPTPAPTNPNPEPAPSNPGTPPASDPKNTPANPPKNEPSAGGEPPKTWEEIFKHPRFVELTDANSALKKAEEDRKKAESEAEEKRKRDAGKHEEIIAELKPKAERAENLEKVIKASVDEMMTKIPDDKKSLIPDGMPVEQQFAWLNKNWALLTGTPRNIGHPAQPGPDAAPGTQTFTESQIQDPEFYAKNAPAIRKAIQENRITPG